MKTGRIALAALAVVGVTSSAVLAQASDGQQQQKQTGQAGQSDAARVTPQEAARPGQQVHGDGFGGQTTHLPGALGVREQQLTQRAQGNQQGQGQGQGQAQGQRQGQAQAQAQGQGQQPQQQSQQQGASAQQGQQAPEGWVLVQERVIVLTANEPQNHFLRAQQLLAQNDAKAAAGELRMAAAYMEMQASRGKGQSDPQLTQSADQLRQMAGRIAGQQQQQQQQQDQQQQGGGVEQQLKQAFAQANCALADHLQSVAQREMQNQKNVMAGHDLSSAAESLAAAYAWSGKQPPQEVTSAIQQSQQLAMKLMMPDADAQQQQQQQQGANASDDAQTAAARMDERGGQAPADASNTVKQLGDAIQQARSSFQGSGGADQQEQTQGQTQKQQGGQSQ